MYVSLYFLRKMIEIHACMTRQNAMHPYWKETHWNKGLHFFRNGDNCETVRIACMSLKIFLSRTTAPEMPLFIKKKPRINSEDSNV